MQSNYLIVDRRILPDYYEKVVQARDMLREGRVKEVSEAVKLVGISRSTYYKYKDYIFAPSNETACKKAVFAFMLSHQQGVLSEVLNKFSELCKRVIVERNACVTAPAPCGELYVGSALFEYAYHSVVGYHSALDAVLV